MPSILWEFCREPPEELELKGGQGFLFLL